MRLIRLALAALALTAVGARAQEVPVGAAPAAPPVEAWLEAGLGTGRAGAGPNTEAGGYLSARMAATVRRGRPFATARMTLTSGGLSPYNGGFFSFGGLRDGFEEVAVLVGYALPVAGPLEVSAAAGVARVAGSRAVPNGCTITCFSTGTSDPFSARVGVPVEVQLAVRLHDRARFGVTGYADFNGEEHFGGVVGTLSTRFWPLPF